MVEAEGEDLVEALEGIGKLKEASKVAKISFSLVLTLLFIKLIFALLSKSQSLLADAIHNFTDVAKALSLFLAIYLVSKKPTKKFPYGLYKGENLLALALSLIMIINAIFIISDAVKSFGKVSKINYPYETIAILLISLVLLYLRYKYESSIELSTFKASSKDALLDSLTTLLVLSSIVFSIFEIYIIDKVLAIAIALPIIKEGIELAKESLFSLLDVSDEEVTKKVKKVIEKFAKVREIKVRKSSFYYFIEGKIEVREKNLRKAHALVDRIEREIKEKVENVASVTLHFEPERKKKLIIAIPLKNDSIASNFAKCESFKIVEVEKGKVAKQFIVKNEKRKEKVRAGLKVIKWLKKNFGVNAIIVRNIGEIGFYSALENDIDVYKSKNYKKDVNLLIKNKLMLLEKPTVKKE